MAGQIPRVQTQDKDFNQYQSNLSSTLQPVLANPINFGAQLASIALVSGDNLVSHGLNKQLTGWFLIRSRAATTVFDKYDSQSQDKTKFIVINASAAATVDFWVF